MNNVLHEPVDRFAAGRGCALCRRENSRQESLDELYAEGAANREKLSNFLQWIGVYPKPVDPKEEKH